MSKPRKLLNMLLTLIIPFSLTGCYDRTELEEMAFVVSLGFDRAPGNLIDVTARVAVPSQAAGQGGGAGAAGGGGGGKEESIGGATPITVRASSLGEAMTLLNASVERRITLAHLSSVLIGDSIAREGLLPYIRPLTRFREVRRTINVFIVQGNVRKAMALNKPLLERSVTRFTQQLERVGRNTSLIRPTELHGFLIPMETPAEDPVAPIITINPKAQKAEKSGGGDKSGGVESGGGDKSGGGESGGDKSGGGDSDGDKSSSKLKDTKVTFEPGQIARIGGNPLEFIGTAVFQYDRMVDTLDGIDTRMLLCARGELQRTVMDFPDPVEKGKSVSLEIRYAKQPVVTVDLNAQPIRVKVREELEAEINGVQSGVDYTKQQNMQRLERSVSDILQKRQIALMNRVYHEHQCDPFGALQKTRKDFATIQELNRYDFRDRLRDAAVDVDVDFHIRRTGVILAPLEPK